MGVPKFQRQPCTKAVLVDSPDEPVEGTRFHEELLVRPELQAATVGKGKKISVMVRNVSA